MNEYTKALKVHKLKRRDGFFETYIIPVIEIAEDLAKFNWSKIANGALSARKLQIELMEAEMNAPGRKVAYIYYAKRRFGS